MKKKKKKDTELKISLSDKLQALIRSEIFLKDLKETLFPHCSFKKQTAFQKKWGIPFPRGNSVEECLEFMQRPFEEGLPPELLFNEFTSVQIVLPDPHVTIERQTGRGVPGKILMDYGSPIRDNTIHLAINLRCNLTDILSDVKSIIKRVRPSQDNLAKRQKPLKVLKVSMWDVYNLHTKSKLKPVEIARKLSGIDSNPSYEPKLARYLKAVQYALQRTSAIIKQSEAEAILPLENKN